MAAIGWLVAGLGMGVGITSLSVLVLELSPIEEQGANAAALQVSDALGSILLIGAAGAIFAGLHKPGQDNAGVFLLIFAVMTVSPWPAPCWHPGPARLPGGQAQQWAGRREAIVTPLRPAATR